MYSAKVVLNALQRSK